MNYRLKICTIVVSVILAVSGVLFAEDFDMGSFSEALDVIDTPTPGLLDYGAYNVNFRLATDGVVLTRINWGVFKPVNIGFSWEIGKIIGSSDNITAAKPGMFMKLNIYSGGMVMPAMAFGYDGQGYFYDKSSEEFLQKEKGIFFVMGREVVTRGLNFNIGVNMWDFSDNKVYGFIASTFEFEEKFVILAEYDNLYHHIDNNRLNFGFRFFVTDDLNVDLSGRDLGASRLAERIIRVNYVGRF